MLETKGLNRQHNRQCIYTINKWLAN